MSEYAMRAILSAMVSGFFMGAAWGIPVVPKSSRIGGYSVLVGAGAAIVFGLVAYWFYRRAVDD